MKNFKKLSIFSLMITILILLNTKAYSITGIVNTDTLRVREEPSTSSKIVEQLSEDDKIEILEEQDDWYKITFKNITGYVSRKYVKVDGEVSSNIQPENVEENNNSAVNAEENISSTEVRPQENTTTEQTEEKTAENVVQEKQEYELTKNITLNILPLINSRKIANSVTGKVTILEKINNWYRIQTENTIGWVREYSLKEAFNTEKTVEPIVENAANIEEKPIEEEQLANKPEETNKVIAIKYVTVDGLNVREQANTSSKSIDSLKKNDEIEILEILDGWYKIKLSKKVGYVSSKYISDSKVIETTSRGNAREEIPNESAEIVGTADTPSSTNVATGEAIVNLAKEYLGYKYVSGGTSPKTGFDCSGFTQYIYKQFGITINRTAATQNSNGVAVSKDDLQLGDLVIFNGESNKSIGHVGIYIGNDDFIHASNPSDGVKITSLSLSYYEQRYVGARRIEVN